MPTSAADARVVIDVEKFLTGGGVILSEKVGHMYFVKLSVPAAVVTVGVLNIPEIGEEYSGWGRGFTEAFRDAHRQLPVHAQAA